MNKEIKLNKLPDFTTLDYNSEKPLSIRIGETGENIQILPANSINETTIIFMDKVIKGDKILELNKRNK